MHRNMLKTLVVIAAAGALAAGLLAQTPMKAAKPMTAVKAPVAPPTPAPAPQGGSANNQLPFDGPDRSMDLDARAHDALPQQADHDRLGDEQLQRDSR